jgi:NAD(P)-dependent dehydrogenase (short-subunit alcohol dehydrogenase family)
MRIANEWNRPVTHNEMTTRRVALVTGANKGIGRETARRLGETGLTVFLAARDRTAGETAAGRIVNVSSGLGSLTLNGDPGWEFAGVKFLGYSASKAALNMLTVQLAHELRDTPIKVNAADPGFIATDLNGHRGRQTVEQGARASVRLALLPEDGPSGGYFDAAGPLPW